MSLFQKKNIVGAVGLGLALAGVQLEAVGYMMQQTTEKNFASFLGDLEIDGIAQELLQIPISTSEQDVDKLIEKKKGKNFHSGVKSTLLKLWKLREKLTELDLSEIENKITELDLSDDVKAKLLAEWWEKQQELENEKPKQEEQEMIEVLPFRGVGNKELVKLLHQRRLEQQMIRDAVEILSVKSIVATSEDLKNVLKSESNHSPEIETADDLAEKYKQLEAKRKNRIKVGQKLSDIANPKSSLTSAPISTENFDVPGRKRGEPQLCTVVCNVVGIVLVLGLTLVAIYCMIAAEGHNTNQTTFLY